MINLDEQKETVSKKACLYVANQLETGKLKMVEAVKILLFLINGIESAKMEGQLKNLTQEIGKTWIALPAFNTGL
jgi:hypothetical protein